MLNESKKPKVFIGLSGGVDSSVAAYLLKNTRLPDGKACLPAGRQGFDVVGVHLRCWSRFGCNVQDAEDARRVAEHLNIPFYVIDLEKEYKEKVIDYMVDGYARGITPNPDVMCNKEIKFGLFLKKALEMGADYIATGHYVKNQKLAPYRTEGSGAGSKIPEAIPSGCYGAGKNQKYNSKFKTIYKLFEAKDKNKDQSYFLWTLAQDQLKHCLFPIGDYLKSEVRAIAKRAGLLTALKKDSQGLCFVGKVALKDFLGEYLPSRRGLVLDMVGNVLGEHEGVQFYTVGQRHGLGIVGSRPYYVACKDAKNNTVVLAEGENNPALYKKEAGITDVSWVSGREPTLPLNILARVRYRQPLFPAILYKLPTTNYKLIFDTPQKFVARGQSAVFYIQDGLMLGGGVIKGLV